MAINYTVNIKSEEKASLFDLVKKNDLGALQATDITFKDLDERDLKGKTLLQHATTNQATLDHLYNIAKTFFTKDNVVDTKKIDKRGRSILHWAAKCNQNADEINALIANGADVNDHNNPFKVTSLYMAAQEGHANAFNALITAGADIQFAAINGALPIHAAAEGGNVELIKTLLDAGCPINHTCSFNGIPLYIAAQKGNIAAVKLLIENGANVNNKCNDDTTPLYIAVQNGNTEVVKLLLEAGADVNAAQPKGIGILECAEHFKRSEIIALLKEAGVKEPATTIDSE